MAAKLRRGSRVPVTVLTGFLGAGKTTLLNHLLSEKHGLRFAIIENEFGEVGVDDKIIGAGVKEMVDEEIIEVMNGCICCTVRGDLVQALLKLHSKVEKFDGVIIETTGLADPAPVAQTFFIDDLVKEKYELDAIVTVVDAKHLVMRLDDVKPEGVENEAQEQLAFADIILLNKVDLVPEEDELKKIETRIRSINSNASIMRTEQSKADWRKLLNVGAFDIDRILKAEPEFLSPDAEHQHDQSVTSCSVKFEGDLLSMLMENWIRELLISKGADLFRYKGVMACKGMKQKFIFQGVGMLFNGYFSEFEWEEGEKRESRFVFIGRNLDKEALTKGILDCRVGGDEPLRFKVGDKVAANAGGTMYQPGTIEALWDQGNPYVIKLLSGEVVHAPADTPDLVIAWVPPPPPPL
eukprot:Hpha_TRINITY_DN16373_c2_g1::TRINITY_DN16373_c2_g1_i2::g.62408::m.62408